MSVAFLDSMHQTRSVNNTNVTRPGPCSRCGVLVPDGKDVCWAAFHAILAREYSDPAHGVVNQFTVDAHALQHPEDHGVKNNAFHLLDLCWLLEDDDDPRLGQGTRWLQRHCDGEVAVPALQPPIHRGDVTVADIAPSASPQEHAAQVRRWAQSVWAAWHEHHNWARQWMQRHGPDE